MRKRRSSSRKRRSSSRKRRSRSRKRRTKRRVTAKIRKNMSLSHQKRRNRAEKRRKTPRRGPKTAYKAPVDIDDATVKLQKLNAQLRGLPNYAHFHEIMQLLEYSKHNALSRGLLKEVMAVGELLHQGELMPVLKETSNFKDLTYHRKDDIIGGWVLKGTPEALRKFDALVDRLRKVLKKEQQGGCVVS